MSHWARIVLLAVLVVPCPARAQTAPLVIPGVTVMGIPQSGPEDKAQLARLFQKKLAFTNAMREAGLEFLAGTDFVPGPDNGCHQLMAPAGSSRRPPRPST
jgi:hypothetical protein